METTPNPPQEAKQAEEPLANMKELANVACESATEIIKQYPITSTLAVAGVGVGVGLLLSKIVKDSPALTEALTDEEVTGPIMKALAKHGPELLDRLLGSR